MDPIGPMVARVLPALLAKAPLSPEKVDFAWRTVAGDALARATRVTLRDGILIVSADDVRWLDEVARARTALLPRLNALLGEGTVRLIRSA
jgi:predicted nucleic acid-binding Zn ribbon protein